jgi:hypothetical protein
MRTGRRAIRRISGGIGYCWFVYMVGHA